MVLDRPKNFARMFKGLIGATALCAALVLQSLLATPSAQAAPRAPAPGVNETQLGTIVIRGKAHRPETFMLNLRYQLALDWDLDDPRFKRSFLERVTQSVWAGPF